MNYKIESHSKSKGYVSAKRHLEILCEDIDREFNGNVKSTYRLYASGNFYVDVKPTVPLEHEHLYISFITKLFDIANAMVASQDDKVEDDDDVKGSSAAMMAVLQAAFTGQAPNNPNLLVQQLMKAKMQQLQAREDKYKLKHLVIEDAEGSFFEAFKSGKEEELRLSQKPAAKFDWKTAYIRIPRE